MISPVPEKWGIGHADLPVLCTESQAHGYTPRFARVRRYSAGPKTQRRLAPKAALNASKRGAGFAL